MLKGATVEVDISIFPRCRRTNPQTPESREARWCHLNHSEAQHGLIKEYTPDGTRIPNMIQEKDFVLEGYSSSLGR